MGVVDAELEIGGEVHFDVCHSKSVLQVRINRCTGLIPRAPSATL